MQQSRVREVTSLYPNNIGVCIKKQGYTQEEIADALGIARRTLSNYISGKRAIPRGYLAKIAQTIGCEIEELTLQPEFQSILSSQNRPAAPESLIPFSLPPHPYFALPYALQQNFVGRMYERTVLTEWLGKETHPILTLVAFGGMGKSALSWSWLQQDVLHLPESRRPVGVLWWSFYEHEASFAVFLNHALTYVSGGKLNPRTIPSLHEKTHALVNLLHQQRYLLVLDGFERELREYMNNTPTLQEDALSVDAYNDFRVCTDLYAGNFLRWLAAGPSKSKVLITTRLFPRELDGLAGCQRVDLAALDDEDAVNFCCAQGVQGTRVEILKACREYGNHPLALRLLTGLVVYDPDQPGDIAVAAEYSPLPEMVQREHHILSLAYDALRPQPQQLLSRIAAFRAKADFKMVRVISQYESGGELKRALLELIERGFIFFDRERALFDLHPIVRQCAYAKLQHKQDIHSALARHFRLGSAIDLPENGTEAPKKIGTLGPYR